MKKQLKIVTLFLAAALACGSFVSCGNSSDSASSVGTGTDAAGTSSTAEVRTIRVLGPDSRNIWETRDKQDSFNKLNEMLAENNLKIEYEVIADEQYQQIVQTRVAAAKDLPDLVNISPLDTATILNLGKRGVFLDVHSLVDQYSNGNVKSFGEKYFPDMWKAATAPDGKTYWMPTHQYITYKEQPFHSNLTTLIRQDWLDKLGITKPTTLDEFTAALTAMQKNDVNGNGEQDEKMIYTPSFSYIAPSFGLPAGLVMIDTDDNKAKSPWLMKEQLVEYINYVKSLIGNNLIDTDAFDKSGEVITQKVQSNKVSAVNDWALGTWNDAYVKDVNGVYEPVMLGKNKGEVPATLAEDSYAVVEKFAVTSACKDQQAVADLFDMIYTEEYSTLYFYGVEGTTFNTNEDGVKVFDPNFKNKDFYQEKATGAFLWSGELPGNQLSTWESYIIGMVAERPDLLGFSEDYCVGQKYWYSGESLLAVPTDEEVATLGKIQNDIKTYSSETLVKLCLGQYDVNNIDEYINTLKKLGLEDYVAIYQARHDRYMEAK